MMAGTHLPVSHRTDLVSGVGEATLSRSGERTRRFFCVPGAERVGASAVAHAVAVQPGFRSTGHALGAAHVDPLAVFRSAETAFRVDDGGQRMWPRDFTALDTTLRQDPSTYRVRRLGPFEYVKSVTARPRILTTQLADRLFAAASGHLPVAEEPAAEGGVVIDVVAAGVSYADLLQTNGAYQMKVPLPFTPGMDAAGVVRSAPPEVGLVAGQRVAVLVSYGWQEVISVPAVRVVRLPDDMSFEAGAAAALNYLTGLFALVWRGGAHAGETLLVQGAAGGVGTAAIQLGRALGLRTIAILGDETKKEFALQSGAHHAVLSRGWLGAVGDLLGERAIDIVLDPVGGDRMTESLRSLAPEGRLLVLGFSAGEIPTVKVNRLLLGNTTVVGVASREFFEQQPETLADLWAQLIDLRRIRALPDPPLQRYAFADARGALRAIAEANGRMPGELEKISNCRRGTDLSEQTMLAGTGPNAWVTRRRCRFVWLLDDTGQFTVELVASAVGVYIWFEH